MSNLDVRTIAKENGVRLWEIADKLGISEPTITRKLRRELPADEKQKILSIIDEIAAAAGALLQKGVRNILVTIGERGALLANQDGIRHIPGIPADAIDTTAAGDTFNGAFAVALAEGRRATDAIAFAQAASAIAVTRRGAQPSIPRRAELR